MGGTGWALTRRRIVVAAGRDAQEADSKFVELWQAVNGKICDSCFTQSGRGAVVITQTGNMPQAAEVLAWTNEHDVVADRIFTVLVPLLRVLGLVAVSMNGNACFTEDRGLLDRALSL